MLFSSEWSIARLSKINIGKIEYKRRCVKSTKQTYETYARESHMQIEVISANLAKKDSSQGNLLNQIA